MLRPVGLGAAFIFCVFQGGLAGASKETIGGGEQAATSSLVHIGQGLVLRPAQSEQVRPSASERLHAQLPLPLQQLIPPAVLAQAFDTADGSVVDDWTSEHGVTGLSLTRREGATTESTRLHALNSEAAVAFHYEHRIARLGREPSHAVILEGRHLAQGVYLIALSGKGLPRRNLLYSNETGQTAELTGRDRKSVIEPVDRQSLADVGHCPKTLAPKVLKPGHVYSGIRMLPRAGTFQPSQRRALPGGS